MTERRFPRFSLKRPAILFGLLLVLVVTLLALWNFVLVHDYNQLREAAGSATFHTTFIVVGSALFLAIIVLATVLAFQFVSSLRWSQRQANFVASVSHELNSPLSSIKLFAQTLRQDALDPDARARFLRHIVADADRLSRIVANILRAQDADLRGDELPVYPGEIELRGFLADYLDRARAIHADVADFTLASGPEAWVELDPALFEQVLDNVVGNSVRYRGDTRARIEFRIEEAGGWVELQVRDEGIGIPPSMLESVFERFYRIDAAERETGRRGMGIGLNVVRTIVRSHGGTVGARSDGEGKGTTVWIRLKALARAEAVS